MKKKTANRLFKQIVSLYDTIYDEAFSHILYNKPDLIVYEYGTDAFGYYWDDEIEIIIWPHLHEPDFWLQVADTLTHELCHAVQDQEKRLHPTNYKKQHDAWFWNLFHKQWNSLEEEWS